MSIASEITRISNNIGAAYQAIDAAELSVYGYESPAVQNSAQLSTAVSSAISASYNAGQAETDDRYDEGYAVGLAAGQAAVGEVNDRYQEGYDDGYTAGQSQVNEVDDRYQEGYDDGYAAAQAEGGGGEGDRYDEGYSDGYASGQSDGASAEAERTALVRYTKLIALTGAICGDTTNYFFDKSDHAALSHLLVMMSDGNPKMIDNLVMYNTDADFDACGLAVFTLNDLGTVIRPVCFDTAGNETILTDTKFPTALYNITGTPAADEIDAMRAARVVAVSSGEIVLNMTYLGMEFEAVLQNPAAGAVTQFISAQPGTAVSVGSFSGNYVCSQDNSITIPISGSVFLYKLCVLPGDPGSEE